MDANTGFRAVYARARELAGDAWAEKAIAEAMTATSSDDAGAAKVRYDALRWYAAKVAPKVYGDRVINEHIIDDLREKPVHELRRELAQLEADPPDTNPPGTP